MSKGPVSFDWKRLGNVELGRKNLGGQMPVLVYRLMQYTMIDVVAAHSGKEEAADMTREAGHLAGFAFAENMLDLTVDFDTFVSQLQKALKDLSIGILRIESADMAALHFMLTVDEDLDCSGLDVTGETVCYYDEGFIAGIFKAYTGKDFSAIEIDCWATGARTCRFEVKAL